MFKERLKVHTKDEKQMKKLSEMKESPINGGTSKLAPRRSPSIASILSRMLLARVKLLSFNDLAQYYFVM